nr:probable alpha-mannosidase At5g13980 isoform X3 [Ipomoea trifida]
MDQLRPKLALWTQLVHCVRPSCVRNLDLEDLQTPSPHLPHRRTFPTQPLSPPPPPQPSAASDSRLAAVNSLRLTPSRRCSPLAAATPLLSSPPDATVAPPRRRSQLSHHIAAAAKAVKKSISMQITSGSEMVKLEKDPHAAFALIIDGKTLFYALEDDMKHKILNLAVDCASVICCRVSQKQKALEADIGVGISRAEGMQVGFDSLYFGRIDYQDRAKRKGEKSLEVVWRASKSLGTSSQIFAGAFPENYEPPSGFYFEFNDDSPVFQDDTDLFDGIL